MCIQWAIWVVFRMSNISVATPVTGEKKGKVKKPHERREAFVPAGRTEGTDKAGFRRDRGDQRTAFKDPRGSP